MLSVWSVQRFTTGAVRPLSPLASVSCELGKSAQRPYREPKGAPSTGKQNAYFHPLPMAEYFYPCQNSLVQILPSNFFLVEFLRWSCLWRTRKSLGFSFRLATSSTLPTYPPLPASSSLTVPLSLSTISTRRNCKLLLFLRSCKPSTVPKVCPSVGPSFNFSLLSFSQTVHLSDILESPWSTSFLHEVILLTIITVVRFPSRLLFRKYLKLSSANCPHFSSAEDRQYGFRSGHSTRTCLIHLVGFNWKPWRKTPGLARHF